MSALAPAPLGRLAAALLVLLAIAFPARAAIFGAESFTLPNGMQVVVVPIPRAPVVVNMLWYRVGAMDEPPARSGLAHFLEHLMFKGTDTLAPGEFSAIVSRNGGQENAFTSQDYTGYFQTVARDRLETMLRLEADRMRHLRLTDDEIETERKVVLEERRSRIENDPGARLSEQAEAALYRNYPYRIPIIGWDHEIRALTHEDIRGFYRQWYAPNNVALVVAGDVTVATLRPLVERYFGAIAAVDLPERPAWREPPHEGETRITLRDARVRQPTWSRRVLAPGYVYGHTEYAYPLEVLQEILSGGATSRLYRRLVVEQGVAVQAGAWYDPVDRGPSVFGLYASPRDGRDLAKVEAAMEAEVAKLLADGVSEDEVARAIQRLQADAIYARDSLHVPANLFGRALSIGLTVGDVESWPDRIGAVTVDQVNAAARAVLGSNSHVTSLLLPKADAEGGAR
ncbi:MAG: M16 family metallopeptidase [Alphaproteobacteria bacterium]